MARHEIATPPGFVRLAASHPNRSDAERVLAAIVPPRSPWGPGSTEFPAVDGLRRFEVDLRLRVGGETAALTTFRKAAYVDLGEPRRGPDGWDAEISWRASGAAPLFPVFSGWLSIGPHALRIEGLYAPPGGVVGRVADRMLLHVAANATAGWMLAEIDRAGAAAEG